MFRSFFLFIFLIFFSYNHAFSENNIAFVDINYIFNNSSAGKKVNKDVKNQTSKLNSELKKYIDKINDDKKKLMAQKNVLSKEEFEKKFRKLEENLNEYNIIIKKKNNDLKTLKKKYRIEFSNKLKGILEDYSKKNSISMILSKENIIIGKTNLDATKDVLNLFDKSVKKISAQ